MALMLPDNADLSEVVELGIIEQNVKRLAFDAILSIQGLGVKPPEEPNALKAYLDTLEVAGHRFEMLADAAHTARMHCLARINAILAAVLGNNLKERPMA